MLMMYFVVYLYQNWCLAAKMMIAYVEIHFLLFSSSFSFFFLFSFFFFMFLNDEPAEKVAEFYIIGLLLVHTNGFDWEFGVMITTNVLFNLLRDNNNNNNIWYECCCLQAWRRKRKKKRTNNAAKKKEEEEKEEEEESSQLKLLAAFLLPYHGLVTEVGKKKKKKLNLVFAMLAEGIKHPHRDAHDVDTMVQGCFPLREMISSFKALKEGGAELALVKGSSGPVVTPTTASEVDSLRLSIGLLLENIKELWAPTLDLVRVAEAVLSPPAASHATHPPLSERDLQDFVAWLEQVGLMEIWKVPRLQDGKQLMAKFHVTGAQVGLLVEAQRKWQILNPNASAEECEAYLVSILAEMK